MVFSTSRELDTLPKSTLKDLVLIIKSDLRTNTLTRDRSYHVSTAYGLYCNRRQGNVPVAFLNPDLDIDLYIELPKGFQSIHQIILVKKGLHRHELTSTLWHDDMREFFETQGILPIEVEICLNTSNIK